MCCAEQLPGQLCASYISVVVFMVEEDLPQRRASCLCSLAYPPAVNVTQTGVRVIKLCENPLTSTFVLETHKLLT